MTDNMDLSGTLLMYEAEAHAFIGMAMKGALDRYYSVYWLDGMITPAWSGDSVLEGHHRLLNSLLWHGYTQEEIDEMKKLKPL